MEILLVFFTIFSQLAVGMTVISAVRQWQIPAEQNVRRQNRDWLVAGGFFLAALIIHFFQMEDSLNSPRAVLNIQSVWWLREMILMMLFGAGWVLSYLAMGNKTDGPRWTIGATALIGILLIVSSGMVYSSPHSPSFNNGIPVIYAMLTACILGTSFSSWFTPERHQFHLVRVLAIGLVIGLLVYLLIPTVWLSGGSAMQSTAMIYFRSPLFWIHISSEYLLGLLILGFFQKIPGWLPLLLLAGEILGRISIFYFNSHASIIP